MWAIDTNGYPIGVVADLLVLAVPVAVVRAYGGDASLLCTAQPQLWTWTTGPLHMWAVTGHSRENLLWYVYFPTLYIRWFLHFHHVLSENFEWKKTVVLLQLGFCHMILGLFPCFFVGYFAVYFCCHGWVFVECLTLYMCNETLAFLDRRFCGAVYNCIFGILFLSCLVLHEFLHCRFCMHFYSQISKHTKI